MRVNRENKIMHLPERGRMFYLLKYPPSRARASMLRRARLFRVSCKQKKWKWSCCSFVGIDSKDCFFVLRYRASLRPSVRACERVYEPVCVRICVRLSLCFLVCTFNWTILRSIIQLFVNFWIKATTERVYLFSKPAGWFLHFSPLHFHHNWTQTRVDATVHRPTTRNHRSGTRNSTKFNQVRR